MPLTDITLRDFTVTSRQGTTKFQSGHMNQNCLFLRLQHLVSNQEIEGEFPRSLVQGYQQYGSWTDKAEAWAALKVAQHDHPERFLSGNRATRITGMQPIVDHIKTSTLKRPTITLTFQSGNHEDTIVLKLNTKGRRPGTIAVSQTARFGEGPFYGYIENDEFEPRQIPPAALQILQQVAKDPKGEINRIGRQSGRCCYCPANLTQVQSKIAGCGKTCARNWDIDYPNAETTRQILSDNDEFLVGATDADRWV